MRPGSLLPLLLLSLLATGLGAAPLEPGDLVYLALPGAAGGAISGASGSRASHIGIVCTTVPEVRVIHAYGRVREEPLARFLARGTGGYAVTRYAFPAPATREAFVAGARSFLGWPYDRHYRIDNRELYCSELVYRAFLDGAGLTPVPLAPMDFRPEDPEIWAFWTRFFQGEVPQGEPGIAPGDYLLDPSFETVLDELPEVAP